ncbi:MAG: hypothetical protein H6541_10805 [Lentimicrobiaceae bacterium]|nr:hypothetical protein [Lentimicrobiaceae bacterium]MCB9023759.1 hypothetical protein [Lentimicrobiaceae bacterium]MCO5265310.1 hypothetical protein [Lentimicrobium sp.]
MKDWQVTPPNFIVPKTGLSLLCLFAFIISPLLLSGQDYIYKTDHTIIEATVAKVSESEIEYRKYSNPKGPVYTIPRNSIRMIIYQNGEKETFNEDNKPQAVATSASVNSVITREPMSINKARMMLLSGDIRGAVSTYAQLAAIDSNNITLASEFAYALGINGIIDAAFMKLDKLWQNNAQNQEVRYFTAQLFNLIGHEQLSEAIRGNTDNSFAPAWISANAASLNSTYKTKNTTTSFTKNDYINKLKTANKLVARNMNLQSMLQFEEIISFFPEEYLPYLGYSIALEKAGMLKQSSQAIEKALLKTGNTPEANEKKKFLSQRLDMVNSKINVQKEPHQSNQNKKNNPESDNFQMLAYAGGMFTSGYASFNTRMGYFIGKSSNVAVDLGFQNSNSLTRVNIGASAYYRWKVLVYGSGVNASFGKDIKALYFKISAGPSFMNRKRTASYDIFWDINVAASKDNPSTFGFSIGRSFYFGKRKQYK